METREAQAQVEDMLEAGASFEGIEAYINGRRDLTREMRSALWLLAWAETTTQERRRVVRELLVGARSDVLPPLPARPRVRYAVLPGRRR
jgi:CelD/BcsL family acetyltransferase involved in cellulose biosynthesis